MGRGRQLGTAGIAIATAVAGLSANLVRAQETEPSPLLTLDLVTSLEADNNADLDPVSPGTTVTLAEILTFGVLSETQTQSLSFTASGALEAENRPGDGDTSFGFEDPSVQLSYSREGANAAFGVSAFYRSTDVSDSISTEDLIAEDLIVDRGSLKTYGADIEFQYGIDSPIELTFSAGTSVREYTDTTDPDLIDSTRDEYGVSADIRLSPVTVATLSAEVEMQDESGPGSTDRDETRYSAALSHELRRGLTLTGDLSFSDTEITESGVRSNEDAVLAGAVVRQELVNGAVTGGISFENRSDDPDRLSLNFGREMDLPDGSLAAGLTLVKFDGSDLHVLANLSYTKELPRGALNVALTQSVTSDSDDEDVLLSTLAIGYEQAINSYSSINLTMDVSRSEDASDGPVTGRTRADLTASYSHELTADWDLNVGYRRRQFDETGGDKAESDAVFLTLSRGIAFGF